MSNTIEDFKRFYMPDNEKKEFNIYDLIKDVVKMEQSALQNHTISIEIKVKDQTLNMYGLESQLKQVSDLTHIRLDIFPDGGVARLRLLGLPVV